MPTTLDDATTFVLSHYEKAAPPAATGAPRLARYKPPTPAAAKPAPVPAPAAAPQPKPTPAPQPATPSPNVTAPAAPAPAAPKPASGFFSRLFTKAPAATPQSAPPPTPAAPAAAPQPNTPEWHANDYKQNGVKAQAFKQWFGPWDEQPHLASAVTHPETGEPQPTYHLPGEEPAAPAAPAAQPAPQPAGASKVLDASGKPATVYHGTPRGAFHTFDKSLIAHPEQQLFGPGFYFTEDPKAAEIFAQGGHSASAQGNAPAVMQHYLNARNPFDIDKHYIDPRELPPLDRQAVRTAYVQKALAEGGRSEALQAGRDFDAGQAKMRYRELTDSAGVGGYGASKQTVQELLQKHGHDALTVQADDVGEPGKNRYWITFDPAQAKSIHNQGTFDPNNPHTLKSYLPSFFKAWSEQSHPRDDGGRFVSAKDIRDAARFPDKATALHASVTNPDERAKLDTAISGAKVFGGVHHANAIATELQPEHDFLRIAGTHNAEGREHARLARGHLVHLIKSGDSDGVRDFSDKLERLAAIHWREAKKKAIAQFRADYGKDLAEGDLEKVADAFDAAENAVKDAYGELGSAAWDYVRLFANVKEPEQRAKYERSHREAFERAISHVRDAYSDHQAKVWDAIQELRDYQGGSERGYKLGRYFKALETLPAPQAIALAARLTGAANLRTRAQAVAAYTKSLGEE